jgi:glycosyltransferase involved in cell wall biosynthesis
MIQLWLIVANRSGCREIVDNNVTGYIVPVNDEKATYDATLKFLSLSYSDRREMGEKGRKK